MLKQNFDQAESDHNKLSGRQNYMRNSVVVQ